MNDTLRTSARRRAAVAQQGGNIRDVNGFSMGGTNTVNTANSAKISS